MEGAATATLLGARTEPNLPKIKAAARSIMLRMVPLPRSAALRLGGRALILLAALGAPAHAAAPLPAHLTIASEGARPPYNYFVGDTLEGFEIDLGRDLCRRMAVVCTFVEQDWDSMIPGLLERRYDAIMAAMEITPAREARIAFSTPYVRMPSAFLVRKGDTLTASSPDALAGKAIGVEAGGTHQVFVEKLYPRSRLRKFNSLDDAILDLEAGRVDAALGDKDAVDHLDPIFSTLAPGMRWSTRLHVEPGTT